MHNKLLFKSVSQSVICLLDFMSDSVQCSVRLSLIMEDNNLILFILLYSLVLVLVQILILVLVLT